MTNKQRAQKYREAAQKPESKLLGIAAFCEALAKLYEERDND